MKYEDLVSALEGKVVLSDQTILQLQKYASLLKEWNEKMNLTAITDEEQVVEKHFYDCLLPLKYLSLDDKAVADLGTGAGFPGMVWAIVNPKCQMFLVEATGKKCTFLEEVKKQLSLQNVTILNKRAEEMVERNRFDIAVARAVAPLDILLEISVPFLKVGGSFVAMKSEKGREEISEARSAMKTLGCSFQKVYEDNLPSDSSLRLNILIKKEKPTDKKYPRDWALIERKPL